MNTVKDTVVISHAGCWDGAAAAWVANRKFGYTAEYLFHAYGKPAPELERLAGKDVYILDFSFPRDVLVEIEKVAKSLLVLDHHATAEKDLEGMSCCTFDMNRSGCRMAWDHFFPGYKVPKVIEYIEDRDLWRWMMTESKAVHATLVGLSPTIDAIQEFSTQLEGARLLQTIETGKAYLSLFDRMFAKSMKKSFYVDILGHKVLFVSGGSVLGSELGNYVALRSNSYISCVYVVGQDGVSMSFRTVNGVDATPLAKHFGGGGHKAACGCKVGLQDFVNLISPRNFEVMP